MAASPGECRCAGCAPAAEPGCALHLGSPAFVQCLLGRRSPGVFKWETVSFRNGGSP